MSYEVELKSLLGDSERMDRLLFQMRKLDPKFKEKGSYRQLNHYFEGGGVEELIRRVLPHLAESDQEKLKKIEERGRDFSVRTREMNGETRLVLKVSADDTTSANGIVRLEFEAPVEGLSFSELDKLLLQCGFKYQAKWSRDRREYRFRDLHVTLDRNAGYGYVAEFEMGVSDPKEAPVATENMRNLLRELELEELPQDRLERMFAYYNTHWQEYYGTEKVFTIL